MAVLITAVFVLAGVLGGMGMRWLLRWLPRGAVVGVGRCEASLAGLWGVTGCGWAAGIWPGRLLPLLLGLGWLGLAAGLVDARHRRLPDALTLPAIPVGLVLLAPLGAGALARGAAGSVVAVLGYGLLHALAPGALGAGDVKLAGSLGAATAGVTWPAVALAALAAGVLTVLLALVVRQRVVPHGPPMLAASWGVVAALGVAGAPLGPVGGG